MELKSLDLARGCADVEQKDTNLSWPCLSTDACMVWCHGTFLTTSSSLSIPTAIASGRRHPCSLLSDLHGCLLSAIVRFWWLEAAFGTVCHLT